jgi:glycerophosphoryl diester phosphodiesterase
MSFSSSHRHSVKIIAHRGNSAQAPENTRVSFQEAINLQVDFLEGDVQFSRDKVPLVIHDGTFHRITKNSTKHRVNELDLIEIQKIDAGSWFNIRFAEERILTLEELLCLPKTNVGVMLDIKEETFTDREMAKILRDVLHSVGEKRLGHGSILLGSLNPHLMLSLETFLPGQTFIPIVKTFAALKKFRYINAQYYALHYSLANPNLISQLHEEGYQVWVWTVDDKSLAKKLIDRGVDGIITNHPKKMMGL